MAVGHASGHSCGGRNVGPFRQTSVVTELAWGYLDTPVGRVSVACTASGVARVRYGDMPEAADPARRVAASPQPAVLARELNAQEPPIPPEPPGTAEPPVATAVDDVPAIDGPMDPS